MSKDREPTFTRRALAKGAGALLGAAAAESVANKLPGLGGFRVGLKEAKAQGNLLDFDIPDGHFYRQTNGLGDNPEKNSDTRGYAVNGVMWKVFQEQGGVGVWGYPVSQEYTDDVKRKVQAFQKGVFQLTVDAQGNITNIEWLNVHDQLNDLEKQGKIQSLDNPTDLLPPYFDWKTDAGLPWGHTKEDLDSRFTVEVNHIVKVLYNPHITPENRARRQLLIDKYFANPRWFEQYGLPMSVKDYSSVIVVRCQRAALQLWKDKTPWTTEPWEVVIANGGDVAKKYGLIPKEAIELMFPPGQGGSEGGGSLERTTEPRYISPNNMFVIDNDPNQPQKGFKPVNADSLAQIEPYLRQYGVEKYIFRHDPALRYVNEAGTLLSSLWVDPPPQNLRGYKPELYLIARTVFDRTNKTIEYRYRWVEVGEDPGRTATGSSTSPYSGKPLSPEQLKTYQGMLTTGIASDLLIYKYSPTNSIYYPEGNSEDAKALSRKFIELTPLIEVVVPQP